MNVGLSDHLPVFLLRSYKQPQLQNQSSRKKHLIFVYRNLKRIDKDMFVKDLNEALWDSAYIFEDTDEIIETWFDIFYSIVSKHALLITKQMKIICQPK